MSVAFCVAAVAILAAGAAVSPASAVLWGVVVTPVFAVQVQLGNQLALGEELTTRDGVRATLTAWRVVCSVGIGTATCAASALVALEVWHQTRSAWVLPSIAVAAGLTVVAVLLGAVVLSLGLQLPRLSLRTLAQLAIRVLAARPVPVVGGLALAGLGVAAAAQWSASLFLLFPGPVAAVLSAGVWTSALQLGLVERTGQRTETSSS